MADIEKWETLGREFLRFRKVVGKKCGRRKQITKEEMRKSVLTVLSKKIIFLK